MPPKRLFKRYYLLKKNLVFVIFFLVLVTGLFFLNDFFRIKKIEVVSEIKNLTVTGLDSVKDKNLVLLDESKAGLEIVEKNSFIKTLKLIKKYPDKIMVEIKINKPLAILKADQGFLYLSDTGKIIEKRKDNDTKLPVINYYQNLYYYQSQAGEVVDYQEIITTLGFITSVTDLGLKVDTVDIAGVYMVAFNLKDKKIFFTFEKDPQVQKYQLATIIKQFKIEGREFSSLDLRFDKPVIRLK